MRKAAASGWAFAFGQYLIGWHWIGYAFMVVPSAHLWQMPFAILILTAGLALYAGIACALSICFWRDGPSRLLVVGVCMPPANGCAVTRSPAFHEILQPMAGARPGP